MRIRSFLHKWKLVFLVSLLLATVMSGISLAATFDLTAGIVNKTLPDGSTVTMWGFGLNGSPITVPGPALVVNPADPTLTINLTNNLPVPISIVIPGLTPAMSPTFVDTGTVPYTIVSTGYRTTGDVTSKVISFTIETPANGTGTYTWTNVKPGTYLYQSGTNPAVQVQMGLYGMLKKDAAAGFAYTGKAYDVEVPLLFSEIDPNLVSAIANGDYINIPASVPSPVPGQPQVTSTIDYAPAYFFINGKSYDPSTSVPIPAGNVGQKVLLRFLNAGLRTHVPVLLDSHMSIIAQDGNPNTYSKEQYSVILPAGKTIDAIFAPQTPGIYPVFDRRLDLSDASYPGGTYEIPEGGMITKLQVGGTIEAPVATDDIYSVNRDNTLIVPAPGVLTNDSGTGPLTVSLVPGTGPLNGTLMLSANGSFTYTPNPGYSGQNSFQYTANNSGGSSPATVTIMVINNTPPVANAQSVATNEDTAVSITLTATDAENDSLTYSIVTSPGNGTLTGTPPNITYIPSANFNGGDSFTFKANDGSADSNVAIVTITVSPVNDAPVAVDDYATTTKNTPIIINILANDYDVDSTINPATVAITTPPTRGGTVQIVTNGVLFTPKNNWTGTDVFRYTVKDNVGGLTSNTATVRVNVVKK